MLSIKSIGQSQSAQHYYTSQDNYYLTDKDSLKDLSYWLGDGAKRLNLSGVVEPKPFLNLLNGELPNGQQLGIIKDGERKHRAGTDVTLSAPKSVSILGLVGQDKRIIEAHQKAVSITFKRIETLAAEARITFNKETTFEKQKLNRCKFFTYFIKRIRSCPPHPSCYHEYDGTFRWTMASIIIEGETR